jgi:hypothetical protein
MSSGLAAIRQAYGNGNNAPLVVNKGKGKAREEPKKKSAINNVPKLLTSAGIKKGSKAWDVLSATPNLGNLLPKLRSYKNFLNSRTEPGNKKRNMSSLVLLLSRRANASGGLNIKDTLNFLLNTKRNLNNYDALAKKLLSENTGRTLFPQAFSESTPAAQKLRAKAQWAELQDAARHWGTGSWQASRSGGVLETIAVATAAAGSGIKVVYWGDANDFPGSEGKGVSFRFGTDDARLIYHVMHSPNKKVLFLKARISLDKLKTMENNLNRQKAWLAAIKNNSTKASLNALKRAPTYANLPLLGGKSAENSRWKGYSYVEPDGILVEMDADGNITISVLEFKITTGKSEGVPAEAYQLAKARRSLLFSFPTATIKNYFVAWQFGTQGNAPTNFYDPYELLNGTSATNRPNANYKRKNEWSKAFRSKLKKDYFVEKLGPARFQTVTGINADTVENILRSIRQLNVSNIASRMASVVRHLPPSAPPPNNVGHARNAELLNKLTRAAGRAGPANCRSRYTNEPARRIGCNKINSETLTNVIRSVKFSEPWINTSGATTAQKTAIRKALASRNVKPLESNNTRYVAHQKYLQRMKAWINRLNNPNEWRLLSANEDPQIEFLRNLKGLNIKGKSDKNTIILRVMQNASLLNPSVVPQLANVLKETNANERMWASIFDPVINRSNIKGALVKKRIASKTLGPAGNSYTNKI